MITKKDLLNWLKEIDDDLNENMVLIAVGGTAMTLLNLKESTVDVDFDVSRKDFNKFKRLILKYKKFHVDVFVDGYIFSEQLPEDYSFIAEDYEYFKFKNLVLKTLHPVDIIITKAARYNARDEDDIEAIIKKIKIDSKKLKERFQKVLGSYAGSEKIFRDNFETIIKRYF